MSYNYGRQDQRRPEKREEQRFPKLDFILTDNPDKLNDSAEKWGKRWSKLEAGTPSSQVRKFFSEIRRLEQKIKSEGWEKNKLEFKLLKAKAAYLLREKVNERKDLVQFIQDATDKVKTIDDFDLFVKYFEAALGYATGFGLKEKSN